MRVDPLVFDFHPAVLLDAVAAGVVHAVRVAVGEVALALVAAAFAFAVVGKGASDEAAANDDYQARDQHSGLAHEILLCAVGRSQFSSGTQQSVRPHAGAPS